jgi:hypothetical protein
MSVKAKQRPARGSRGGTKRGTRVVEAETDWLPWAYTPKQAAEAIGVPLKTIREMMRIGWLRPLRPGHPAIGAHLVERLKRGRPY